jgi:hypothetical protein
MFRKKIERLIEAAAPNTEYAGKLICQFLENELELSSNGWFDDDPILNALFSESDEDDPTIEAASEELFERVEAILTPQEA